MHMTIRLLTLGPQKQANLKNALVIVPEKESLHLVKIDHFHDEIFKMKEIIYRKKVEEIIF